MGSATILWFRRDLRLGDHPALAAAARRGPVVPLYIHAPQEEGEWAAGAASRWWLHQSLASLAADLERAGARLVLRTGDSLEELRAVVRETNANAVYWSRRYEPALIARDARIENSLAADGVETVSFNSALLLEPWEVQNSSGKPFQVFTPYWRAGSGRIESAPPALLAAPRKLTASARSPRSLELGDLALEPEFDWAAGLRATWTPGEAGARTRLAEFVDGRAAEYSTARDFPAEPGTSRLSPHLHFGELGPRQIWHAIAGAGARSVPSTGPAARSTGWRVYLGEIGWREFAHHLLYHFPESPSEPLRAQFRSFPWRRDPRALRAWQRGATGYPLVDAGMRELWHTGWMHNRVRMVVASFLVKHLLIRWQQGARWFWDTLVDADLANNTLGWQWSAGCGADAAPYFRVFNPTLQGRKFDPAGSYIRRWVPELARLDDKWIHEPAAAPPEALARAGVTIGVDYPKPIVEHAHARARALEAYAELREDAP